MKRIARSEIGRIKRIAMRRERRNLRCRLGKRLRFASKQQHSKSLAVFAARHGLPMPQNQRRLPVLLPEIFSLRENYEESIGVIHSIRDAVFRQNRPVMLYFDKVRRLGPSAALILTAEIFRCRKLRVYRHGHMVHGNYPADQDVYAELREMGFFKIIEVDDQREPKSTLDRGRKPYFVKFQTYTNIDGELASDFCNLVLTGAFDMEEKTKRKMVAAIKEAMGNAHEHGYLQATDLPTMKKRWWMCGYVDPMQREMMITVLDQGVGIPRTLDPSMFERIQAILSVSGWTPSDGNMIKAATELHRTSTGQTGRGKGFRDMKRFIDACDDGELRVMSNAGRYRYMKDGEEVGELPLSIGGTIVEWRVRHGDKVEVQDG